MAGERKVSAVVVWLVPVLAFVAAFAVGGGLLARELYALPEEQQGGLTASAPPSTPSTGQVPPPGSPEVQVSPDVAKHPDAAAIRELLQTYFDAINRRDYALWTSVVTPQWAEQKTRQQWLTSYRSTRDGDILLHRITVPAGTGGSRQWPDASQNRTLLVSFTSTQDPSDAPRALRARCIRWRIGLTAVRLADGWKLQNPPERSAPSYERC